MNHRVTLNLFQDLLPLGQPPLKNVSVRATDAETSLA